MPRFYFLMALLMLGANVLAQPATTFSEAHNEQMQREPQRSELRSALQAPRQTGEQVQAHKHLSPKERDELRQQLRQLQHEPGKAKP